VRVFAAVTEYPVVWSDSATATSEVWAGALCMGPEGVQLRGGNGSQTAVHDLPREEVTAVGPVHHQDRLFGNRALRVELRTGRAFIVACLTGRHLSEVLETFA